MFLACLLACLEMGALFAQDATLQNAGPGQSAMEESRQRKAAMEQRRADKALLQQPIVFSGFLVDYSRAENKPKYFSLRKPVTPARDVENHFTGIRTGRPKGIVLFALSF
jgi:hypothetical protein